METNLNSEKLIEKYQHSAKDRGSIEVQIIDMTAKINHLIKHFENHKYDNSSRRGLQILVSRRRKFLDYIKKNNEDLYKKLIVDLDLRK